MSSDLRLPPLLLLAGCGSVLADGGYRGEVLLTFEGSVVTEVPAELLDFDIDKMRITVTWLTPEQPEGAVVADVDVDAITSFPAEYTLHLYQPPPEEALFEDPWTPGTRIAIAAPMLYIDADGDGSWKRGVERVVGGSFDVVGVWSERSTSILSPDAPFVDTGGDTWLDTYRVDTASDTGQALLEISLDQGYQKMFASVNWCAVARAEATSPAGLFPSEDAPVNLYVGELWEYLTDWRCGPWRP